MNPSRHPWLISGVLTARLRFFLNRLADSPSSASCISSSSPSDTPHRGCEIVSKATGKLGTSIHLFKICLTFDDLLSEWGIFGGSFLFNGHL